MPRLFPFFRRVLLGGWLAASTLARAAEPAPAIPPAPTRDELFLQVFGHLPPKIPISSYVTVVVDDSLRQKVRVLLPPDEHDLRLEGKSLAALLAPFVSPEIARQLEKKIDAEGWLDRAVLETAGLTTAFDRGKFELAIAFPPGLREKKIRYLNAPLPDPLSVDALRPAPISGFLNFNLKGSSRRETTATSANNLNLAAYSTEGAVNLQGLVLEGSAFGQSGDQRLLQRGDVRLVFDQPRRALRYTLGDLNFPVIGYQRFVELGGIGMTKDFSLQPHVPTYRTGQFDFYLERPAEVQVWANESLLSTLQLPAGAHDIRGLTPVIGQNDLRLVVEDAAGRRELLHFSFIFNPVLLDRGRKLFSYNAGFRRELRDGVYRYDPKQPVLSASYLAGLTDETTLGGYIQTDKRRALFGLKALHVFSLGTLQLDAAASQTRDATWDAGAKLELTAAPPARGGPRIQSQVAVEFISRNFGSIDFFTPAVRDAINVSASLAAPLGRQITGHLSGNYSSGRSAGTSSVYGAAATLTRPWGQYVASSLSLRHGRTNRETARTELLFGISISFARGAASYYAAKELESDAVAARWDSGRPSNGSAAYGFASTRLDSADREYRGGGGYWGNQGLAEISQLRSEIDSPQGRSVRNETAVRLESALVFAGATTALGRPVAENFAIVTGKEGLARVDLKVDPDSRGGSRARSTCLSPAVLGDLSSYRLRDVRVEPINPPLGATPERLTFALAPTYKSGFLLRLGKEPRIVAVGRLIDEQHVPLANFAFEVRRIDRPDEKPLTTFSGQSGAFQLPDLRPGRYEIRPGPHARRASVTVEIPATPDGLLRLGEIMLPSGS